ncbi:UDP-N-acetylmuramoyl-tripeptide--D-alanyl-D-alanine ligase [Undibacterium cyanobacteriorum]|uniref:UDP-N-acetylmuramoyl-tripeptide--D-alanyl-D-alanine ligase n=1 Tax=Undibacterium cyanobacteriorum TaxID=3073561 RepID=A0ABY9RMX2_9BURK|nr:UDP-N-acetylmuramoyl-tripeptide--D-alanyl-D-alanine ligase [Undibacterium sp. 20NA77.5]WMW82559.1 UDP-N-acetylmuramoyl-tripeptide--D-alanyl-D-alanine ligase [Undibacterium sp. 20NA77.5]
MRASLQQLQNLIPGAVLHGDAEFSGLSTDSRQVPTASLFVALRGERFDAHDFLEQVQQSGAAALVVEHLPANISLPALQVPDTKQALLAIGRFWRTQFSIPVIGVTGSNGKTTVKEMIASILLQHFGEEHMVATKGNLNNEIGVPLTLMRLHPEIRAAVIEMGMNHPGEIAQISASTMATVALVNNAQREHQEFMQSVEAVAIENGSVIRALSADGVAVFPADDTYTSLWQSYVDEMPGRRAMTFGLHSNADVFADVQVLPFGSKLKIHARGQVLEVRLAAAGQHNVLNALAASTCCLAAGIPLSSIVQGLEKFSPVNGRLQPKQASGGARVIDDTYNANPDSVRAAIDVLAAQSDRTSLILGDMGEVGADGAAFHREIGEYAKQRGIQHLFTLGSLAKASSDAFGAGAQHFEDIAALLAEVKHKNGTGNTLLVKGSRFMKMERVVADLTGQGSAGH